MLAELLSNYPLDPVSINGKLENSFRYRDRDSSLAKRILAEFQAQFSLVKSRTAFKQSNNLMLDQAMLPVEAITLLMTTATVVCLFQRSRWHRQRDVDEVFQNPLETKRLYARDLWRGGH